MGCKEGNSVGSALGAIVGTEVCPRLGSGVGNRDGKFVGGIGSGVASTTMTKGNPPRYKAAMRPRRNHNILEELPVFRVDAPID